MLQGSILLAIAEILQVHVNTCIENFFF